MLVSGGWSVWGAWICDTNIGVKRRSRKCNNPVPSNGGQSCLGYTEVMGTCTKTNNEYAEYDEYTEYDEHAEYEEYTENSEYITESEESLLDPGAINL